MNQAMPSLPIYFDPLDFAAVGVLFACWLVMGWIIENPPRRRLSTSALMAGHRRQWMANIPTRENRVGDAILLTSLRTGAAFFASGTMLAIGGLFAAMGQIERIVDVASDLGGPIDNRAEVWEAKLFFLLLLVVSAFLRFVWSHRIFGYCAVLLGAMPERGTPEEVEDAVARATALNDSAARSFNRGLRGVYFSIAALAWFLGPIALIGASLLTVVVLVRREFLSASRRALMTPAALGR